MEVQLKKKLFIALIVLCTFVAGCTVDNTNIATPPAEKINNKTADPDTDKVKAPTEFEINISAVGDVMLHGPQLKAHFNHETGEYDFSNNFKYIKQYITKSDLAICNLETTLAGKEQKYSSYPKFNSPDSIAHALKAAGFDLIVTANNHTVDMGKLGVERTMSVLDDLELKYIGTRKSQKDDFFIVKDINNIKLGIFASTYETSKYRGQRTLNGLIIPSEVSNKISTFNYNELDLYYDRIQSKIIEMEDMGAEIIIAYLHWGNEYKLHPNEFQQTIAQNLSDLGVDIILGSHPHVIQPVETINSQKGKTTLVAYSLGNFLSNQRYELMNKRHTEDGMILNIKITKNLEDNTVKISQVDYIPTWVNKYWGESKNVYEILPLINTEDPLLKLTDTQAWRANNSRKNTIDIIESSTSDMDIELYSE